MATANGTFPTIPSSACCAVTASPAMSAALPASPPVPSAFSTPQSEGVPGKRKIHWFDVHAGDVAREMYYPQVKDEEVARLSEDEQRRLYLPDDTLKAFEYYALGLKGPLTTPIGGGFRSINVYLRIRFDLYACVRPVKHYKGVDAPNKNARQGQHGDLPREHRRRVLRHRVQERYRPGEEDDRRSQGNGLQTSRPRRASASSR